MRPIYLLFVGVALWAIPWIIVYFLGPTTAIAILLLCFIVLLAVLEINWG